MPSDVVTWPVTVSASTSRTFWPLRIWSAEARFVATVVLPTPPFGLKTAMTVARVRPAVGLDRAALEDRAGAVVDGLAADAHRLDPPAERLGGVGPGEVLVLDVARASEPSWSRARWRDDHERRDGPAGVAQQRVVLERLVEVGLAVEDRDRDVAAARQERLELVGVADGRDREAGVAQLGGDRGGLARPAGRRRWPVGPRSQPSGLGVARRSRSARLGPRR